MQPLPGAAQCLGAAAQDTPSDDLLPRSRAAAAAQPSVPPPHFVDYRGNAPPYQISHDLSRLMEAVPHGACARFTSEHLAALDVALARIKPRPGAHKMDFRVSIPVFSKRYYFVLLGGKERRSRTRIASEGLDAAWRVSVAYIALLSAATAAVVFLMVVMLYAIKSMLGIDMFEGHSWLHGLFY